MELRTIQVSSIHPSPYNPRKDLGPEDAEYQRIAASLEKFGSVEPLVWNERSGNLVGGHQRFKILRAQPEPPERLEVSVVNLSPEDEKRLNLALNKVAGDWDLPKLGELMLEMPDLSFTGFDAEELTKLFGESLYVPNEMPEMDNGEVTQGDVDSAAQQLEGRFTGGRALREVACPHCGREFGIDAA